MQDVETVRLRWAGVDLLWSRKVGQRASGMSGTNDRETRPSLFALRCRDHKGPDLLRLKHRLDQYFFRRSIM